MIGYVGFMPRCGKGDVLGYITPAMLIAIGDNTALVFMRDIGPDMSPAVIERLRAKCGLLIEIGISENGKDVAIAVPGSIYSTKSLERLRVELEETFGQPIHKIYLPPIPFIDFCGDILAQVPMAPVREVHVA